MQKTEVGIVYLRDYMGWLAEAAAANLPESFLRDLLIEGIINGVGSVVVFLPQIVILFLFILILEASGYMVRAALLMDRLMSGVGLSGRAFIPLLSSFACAIPGIMAARSIDDPKERLTTILIAPLMTCSARLPVYAVIIGAFIPATTVGWGIGLQGLVLFGLYVFGIVGAIATGILVSPDLGGTGVMNYETGKAAYDFAGQMMSQLKAVAFTLLWSGIGSAILFKIVDVIVGLRVSVEQEREGLDVTEHTERAYNM